MLHSFPLKARLKYTCTKLLLDFILLWFQEEDKGIHHLPLPNQVILEIRRLGKQGSLLVRILLTVHEVIMYDCRKLVQKMVRPFCLLF